MIDGSKYLQGKEVRCKYLFQTFSWKIYFWHGRMDFEKKIQSALKTLRSSLEHHESQKKGYERTITRLTELQKTVPSDAKVVIFRNWHDLSFH